MPDLVQSKIPLSFITYACEILADTETGLKGAQIVKLSNTYAVEFNVDIPCSLYPFAKDIPNKRTALLKNIVCFKAHEQFKILNEICNLRPFKNNIHVRNLKDILFTRYAHLNESTEVIKQFNTYKSTPVSNISNLVKLIDNSEIIAIQDDYFDNKSLATLLDMYNIGQRFSKKVQILTTPKQLKKLTQTFIKSFEHETGLRLQIKVRSKGDHERLIFLKDTRCISPDFSLNDFNKNGHITTLGDCGKKFEMFKERFGKARKLNI